MKKFISILGSTGSIGVTSLNILNKKKKLFKINILAADKNFNTICKQIKKYKPIIFAINNKKILFKVKKKFKNSNCKIIHLNEINKYNFLNSDILISAIPGIAGLTPTINVLKKSKKLLIANKESVICGWKFIYKIVKKKKIKVIPIDSEHYGIMSLIRGQNINSISKIYLTASGGPFLNYKISKIKNVSPQKALKHPRWKMGKKISIDSATLMNKILELVEAQKIFNLPEHKLDIIIHPESLVHAILEFNNGLIKFIYHDTSMVIPIANAIFDNKLDIKSFYKSKKIKNDNIKSFNFMKVNKNKFPIINIKKIINKYNSSPIIINAVNEILVDQFLKKKIAFYDIYRVLLKVLKDRNYKKFAVKDPRNIKEIFQIDDWARKITLEKI